MPNKRSTRTEENSQSLPNRRTFCSSAVAIVVGIAGSVPFEANAKPTAVSSSAADNCRAAEQQRQTRAWQIRTEAALVERNRPLLDHPTNGDEDRYPNKIANYTKGLPHNLLGEVDIAAWNSLVRALDTGEPADFENIQTNGGSKLVNPQGGLAFVLQGCDSHAMVMRPAPAFSSAEQAGEIAENYWMALARDIPFSAYTTDPLIEAAAKDLSRLSDFRGPKDAGRVTPATLFRGVGPGELVGPYLSQFFWLETLFGAETIDRRMRTRMAGVDYMTAYADWLSIQDGVATGSGVFDSTPRYIRNGRDLGEWVHIDVLFQAYFNALLILFQLGAPLDAGNPYKTSRNQIGFGTLGAPYVASILCAVARDALKAVWYQKWFVHRRARPEVFAGRVHNHAVGATTYPIHNDILNSTVMAELFKRNGSYLLPQAFPEGSPMHPSYGAGHATVAGACVTILKAFFDESFVIPNPVEPTTDGLRLVAYTGPPLTVGGELNKLASNVASGRNFAGIHWRSDMSESLKLGEELAIRYLEQERHCFNEQFPGNSLTKFDGTVVTV
jgi:hypothetical protein